MADKQPSTAKLTEPTDAQQKNGENKEEVKKLPQLGALEDDDEFEEFPADAGNGVTIADALQKGASGDSLWEAGWDDEDIEDDFAKKLRDTIEKKNASGGDQAMQ